MGLSLGEIIIIGVVLMVVFSASRMSALGNAIGKFVYSFRKASNGRDFVDVPQKQALKGARGTEEATVIPPDRKEPREPR